MRFSIDKLSHQLAQQTPRVLLLNGNEVLLVEETLDQIRQHCRKAGFTERLTYSVEAGFDWNAVSHAEQTLSLFAESRCIELRINNARPGDKGSKFIIAYCNDDSSAEPSTDILVIVTALLTKQQRQAKWVKAVEKSGWLVDCYDIKPEQFPAWIKQRLQHRALRVEAGVVDVLTYAMAGNLLAAAQTIEQLRVLSDDGAVTMELLQQTMADQSRFSVFNLIDSCLLGDSAQSLRRLQRLRSDNDSSVSLVWSLAKEVRELIKMAVLVQRGDSVSQVMQQYRVWSNRQRMVSSALHRLSVSQLQRCLQQILHVDAIGKGQQSGDAWHELEKLCLSLCGIDTLQFMYDDVSSG